MSGALDDAVSGWPGGSSATSAVMRAQTGIEAPDFGPFTDAMLLGSPAVLPAGALQPRAGLRSFYRTGEEDS